MRIVLLGAPGAGKGTQAVLLAEKLNVPHISTGDIFRSNIANGTELGRKAKEYIDKGELVPDEVTVDIVKDRLENPDCKKGFILDGFPRTISQAERLDEILEGMGTALDYVINIEVDDEYIIKRLTGRRVCPGCGASYHITNNPPARPGICDKCGMEIIQRKDDNEETILNRLKTYHIQTEPLIDYYRKQGKLFSVDGRLSIEETTGSILKAVGVI